MLRIVKLLGVPGAAERCLHHPVRDICLVPYVWFRPHNRRGLADKPCEERVLIPYVPIIGPNRRIKKLVCAKPELVVTRRFAE